MRVQRKALEQVGRALHGAGAGGREPRSASTMWGIIA